MIEAPPKKTGQNSSENHNSKIIFGNEIGLFSYIRRGT